MQRRSHRAAGFGVIEILIVLVVVGLMAALAAPYFGSMQAKARQAEAKNNLTLIYTLQRSYANDTGTYAAVPDIGRDNCAATNALGFRPARCEKARYTYSVTDATADGFLALATADSERIVPGCLGKRDVWRIDQTKALASQVDALTVCR